MAIPEGGVGRPLRFLLKSLTIIVLLSLSFNFSGCSGSSSTAASNTGVKNVILFIGDGMGFQHVEAARYYANGGTKLLSFEALPFQSAIATNNAEGQTTDSAASGTAMATGYKVSNGVVATNLPGDGSDLETVLEVFARNGRVTGLVTTTILSHATPASFGAHVTDRGDYDGVVSDYLTQTTPELLLGGAEYLSQAEASGAGYSTVTNRAELLALLPYPSLPLAGLFGATHLPYEFDGLGELPHLSDKTKVALAALSNDVDGFFLLVEGGRIDHASHSNDLERMIPEVLEFANAVDVAVFWAQGRDDTLILVTADHECGGLMILTTSTAGNLPTVSWSTTGHTSDTVPLYGSGPGAEGVAGLWDNTQIHSLILSAAGF